MIGKWGHILLGIIVSCAIVSCGGHSDRASLVALDSLILQDPDSACELLATYPADSLTNADDRAYHALLTTIADYKAYRPATTDSIINIAVSHYDHNAANPDHRMRSLLYKGCVMEELGNLKEAMRCYKEAQYACPDNDNFHKGYIHYRIGTMYKNQFKSQNAIEHYKKSYGYFKKTKNNPYYIVSIKTIGDLYCSIDKDSANFYANRCIELAQETNDESLMLFGYTIKARLHFYNEEWEKTKEWSKKILDTPDEISHEKDAYYYLCISYIKTGDIDSAQIVMNKTPMPISSSDSLSYYQCLSNIAEANHLYDNSVEYQKVPDNINTSIDHKLQDNSLIMIENECDNEHKQNSYIKIYRIVFLAVIFLVAVILFYYFRNKRLKKRTESLIEETSHLQKQISSSLLKVEHLKKELVETENKHLEELTNARTVNSEILKNAISHVEISIDCYSSLLEKLLRTYKSSSGEKNQKIRNLLTEDFFEQLHRYINLRFNGLTGKLDTIYNLTQEEINIVCLDLCKFPTSIIWVYSDCDKIHSVYNKKKIIAKKVNNCDSIAQIPETIN